MMKTEQPHKHMPPQRLREASEGGAGVLWGLLVWLLLVCMTIVSHGCHGGDHDDELSGVPEVRRE
jgi:hypothetical protein